MLNESLKKSELLYLKTLFESEIAPEKQLSVLIDSKKSIDEQENKLKLNISNTTYSYMTTRLGLINIQENIDYSYKPSFVKLSSFFRISKIYTLIFRIHDLPFFGETRLYYGYQTSNQTFSIKLVSAMTLKTIFKKNYKINNQFDCSKDLRSIFLNEEELEFLSASNFTDLKEGWYETLKMVNY